MCSTQNYGLLPAPTEIYIMFWCFKCRGFKHLINWSRLQFDNSFEKRNCSLERFFSIRNKKMFTVKKSHNFILKPSSIATIQLFWALEFHLCFEIMTLSGYMYVFFKVKRKSSIFLYHMSIRH